MKFKILLVDDESAILDTIPQLLSLRLELEHETFTATNADSGWKLVQEKSPHLVITDYQMPGENGLDFCCKIKRIFPKIAVILTTGGEIPTLSGSPTSPDNFLPKPFVIENLVQAIKMQYANYLLFQ